MAKVESTNDNRRKVERAQQGTARAALLGISDGLVTNVSLILGVAGAGAPGSVVRIAGTASLIAGAFSMALGEYVSMRGQIELLEGVLKSEKAELAANPEAVHDTIEEILIADGLSKQTAHKGSLEIGHDADKAMEIYAKSVLGINTSELGSAWGAAASSFVTFSLGALVPLIPWFFSATKFSAPVSIGLSIVAALAIGGYMGQATSGRWVYGAIRQLIIITVAALATFFVGHLFHATLT
jgi:VIT1/CCC1 family predicted Fe2+/Mn2+ transporter